MKISVAGCAVHTNYSSPDTLVLLIMCAPLSDQNIYTIFRCRECAVENVLSRMCYRKCVVFIVLPVELCEVVIQIAQPTIVSAQKLSGSFSSVKLGVTVLILKQGSNLAVSAKQCKKKIIKP